MPTKLTATSLKRLIGLHPHLAAVARRAAEITTQPFQITEGTRTSSRQRQLLKAGASRTLKSRHIPAPNGLGHALDVVAMVAGRISWEVPLYYPIADAFKQAGRELGIAIEWGGDWKGFFDGVHFQLPWAEYPGVKAAGDPPVPQPTERELATILPGAAGEAVMILQGDLNTLGHHVKVDGHYGPVTRRAVLDVTHRLTGKRLDAVTVPIRAAIAKAAAKASKKATH